jgi:hypothetical protein
VLARLNRRRHNLEVVRHLHRNGDDVDLRRRHQFGEIREGARDTACRGRRLCAGAARVGDPDDLEVIRQGTKRWNVRDRAPASPGLQAHETDPETLFSHCSSPR